MADTSKRSLDESELSRRYALLEKVQPDPDLDRAILEQAHQANADKSQPRKTNKAHRLWTLDSSLALAAVVVLSASLLILMPNHHGESLPSVEPASRISQADQRQQTIAPTPVDRSVVEDMPNHNIAGARAFEPTLTEGDVSTASPDMLDQKTSSGVRAPLIDIQSKRHEVGEPQEVAKDSEQRSAALPDDYSAQGSDQNFEQSSIDRSVIKSHLATENLQIIEGKAEPAQSIDAPMQSREKSPAAGLQAENELVVSRQARQVKSSIETSIKDIKLLIKKDNIKQAKVIYRQLLEQYTHDELRNYLSDQQIVLLTTRD